ncbi:DUF4214 domain-containing protein [Roseococcus sp. SYP-B2431]|uniref:DUF4214 domain-containing protein n=1 Tax=Roseococcus sp. SYP-B2431 TaxID=2496640 RepID=UPI00103BC5F2|nr:DUF4214 domain-containing protein [Roseococcus sp. SYP-B2431]TCH98799.1 DUF4214 domain-containing protein [Roseococcus sp. SYP-B2431]
MTILLSGSLPGLINENTPLWDWMGQLRLGMDPSLIRFVDITGTGADYFDATLNRATGMVEITPIALADYESFLASGRSPTLSLGLRFFMADGTVQQSQNSYSVTVLNLDDTAPQSLGFSSGGRVEAGQAGAVIGTLAVTDPDTASGFTYTVREDDQWVFEIVDGVLRLRSGVALSVSDGPMRSVVIEVWDGTQSSAFTLDIQVALPGSGGQAIDLFEAHESRGGFYWSHGAIVGDRMSYELASLRDQGAYTTMVMRDGESFVFEEPTSLRLLDGTVYFGGDSKAAWLWSAVDTVLNREQTNFEMWANHAVLGAVIPERDFLRILVSSAEFQNSFGTLDNTQFIERLYLNTTGVITGSGVAYHAQRLANGTERAQLVEEFMKFRKDLGQTEARADQGILVPNNNVQQLDVILRVGGGGDSEVTRFWYDYYASGLVSLDALAHGIVHAPSYAANMGALDNRAFVQQFHLQALGYAPEAWFTDLFTSLLDVHAMSRPNYIMGVVSQVGVQHDSYVYHAPDGAAFANPW